MLKKSNQARVFQLVQAAKSTKIQIFFSRDLFSFKQKNSVQFGPKNKNRVPYSIWKKKSAYIPVNPATISEVCQGVETAKMARKYLECNDFFSARIQNLIRLARSDGKQIMLPGFLRSNIGGKLFRFLFVCVRSMEILRNTYVKRFFFDLIGEDGSNLSIYSDHIQGRILGIKEALKCDIYDGM